MVAQRHKETKTQVTDSKPDATHATNFSEKPNDEPNVNNSAMRQDHHDSMVASLGQSVGSRRPDMFSRLKIVYVLVNVLTMS